jgi:hypothetical protein
MDGRSGNDVSGAGEELGAGGVNVRAERAECAAGPDLICSSSHTINWMSL